MGYDEGFEDELERARTRRSRKKPVRNSGRNVSTPVFAADGPDIVGGDSSWETEGSGSGGGKKPPFRRGKRGADKAGDDKKHISAKKKRRRIIIIILEILLLCIIAVYAYFAKQLGSIQRLDFNQDEIINIELEPEQIEAMKGYKTIAVFGVDSRDSNIGKGTNSDVIMICNINMDTGEIQLVSIFRDTYMNVSDKNTYAKVNSAYANGGPELAVKVLNKNLDLNITDYATFNWKTVAEAIDILGGVDVEISKAEFYYINAFITETVKATGIGSVQLKKAGMNHLDGVQAVAYGRLRLMDTDYARTERQKLIIKLAFEKAKKADWAVLNNLMVTVFPNVASSLDAADIIPLARSITKYYLSESMGFPMARVEMDMGKRGDCVIPQTLESNVIQLHQFMFGNEEYTPTATLKKISEKISANTGLYNAGSNQPPAKTGGGVIPSSKPAATKPVKETEETTLESTEAETYETDEFGNEIIPETDDNGETIPRVTDEYGRPVETTRSPLETSSQPSSSAGESTSAAPPTGPGDIEDTNIYTKPGETNPTNSYEQPTTGTERETTAPVGSVIPEVPYTTQASDETVATAPGGSNVPSTKAPGGPTGGAAPTTAAPPISPGTVASDKDVIISPSQPSSGAPSAPGASN